MVSGWSGLLQFFRLYALLVRSSQQRFPPGGLLSGQLSPMSPSLPLLSFLRRLCLVECPDPAMARYVLDTMILVPSPKNKNVKCAILPHLTRIISRYVWQLGAFCLSLLAIMANSRTIHQFRSHDLSVLELGLL